MKKYYDVEEKLLQMRDLDGDEPAIYFCVGGRGYGKTFSIKRYLLRRYLQNNEKFLLIYRFNYELADCHNAFMYDIVKDKEFVGLEMSAESEMRGLYKVLSLNGKECGYAVYLNSVDTLKKFSARFNDVRNAFMDECISETDHYCENELQKFESLNSTVARGYGQRKRDVRYLLSANVVKMFNPYFVGLGVTKRLMSDTKLLRGNGWVLERIRAREMIQPKRNAFDKAFAGSKYSQYAQDDAFLNDSDAFIVKLPVSGQYQITLKKGDTYYGVWRLDSGFLYCTTKHDPSCKRIAVLDKADHNDSTLFLPGFNRGVIIMWREYFAKGFFKFQSAECKDVLLDFLC